MKVTQINDVSDLQKVFEQTLNMKEKELRTILEDKPLVYLVGKDFSEKYMKERVERKIFLKSLRVKKKGVDKSEHKNYSKYFKEARVVPTEVNIRSSFVIWDNKVAIIDYEDVSGILIESETNAQSMKKWFDNIWNQSS